MWSRNKYGEVVLYTILGALVYFIGCLAYENDVYGLVMYAACGTIIWMPVALILAFLENLYVKHKAS